MSQTNTSQHPSRTPRRTMKIRQVATGVVFERNPPDANECVQSGGFEFVHDGEPSAWERLDSLGVPELAALARSIGVIARVHDPREHLRDQLLQLVEAGSLTLSEEY